ncbi:MAG: hypothetical protein EAX96_18305 [Candidatus Lokiarchaeota archaeon]|nr:hypothetical protein [Candidatus Lokiarchaeota archaeon]
MSIYENDDLISKKMSVYLKPGEKLLFKTSTTVQEGLFNLYITSIPVFLLLGIFFIVLVTNTSLGSITRTDIMILPGLAVILMVPVIILIGLINLKSGKYKIESTLFITDQKIYVYIKNRHGENVSTIEYINLEAVIFKEKKLLDLDSYYNRIEFIIKRPKTVIITIKNIEDMISCQKVIESVLYHYGEFNIHDNKKSVYLEKPLTLSKSLWNQIIIRIGQLKIYLGLNFIISFIIGLISYIFMPLLITYLLELTIKGSFTPIPNLYELMQIAIIILVIFCSMIVFIGNYWEYSILKKGVGFDSDKLVLKDQLFILESESKLNMISINNETCLDYLKLKKLSRYNLDWDAEIKGLVIKSSYNSKKIIYFGPLKDFSNIYKSCYWYMLQQKNNQNLLYPINELHALHLHRFYPEEPSNGVSTQQFTQKKTYFEQIDENNELYEFFNDYMVPKEKIIFSYKCNFSNSYEIKRLVFGISLIIIAIILMIFSFLAFAIPDNAFIYFLISIIPNFTYQHLMIVAFIGVGGFGLLFIAIYSMIAPAVNLLMYYIFKNSVYVFTDKKIMIQYPSKRVDVILYDNISTITRKDKKDRYDITIELKKSTELSGAVYIPRIPRKEDLIDKINYLKESSKMQQE